MTADDVVGALDEFDALGRREFLSKYGFGESRSYFLVYRGKEYDSKAVVGAAHTRRHGVRLTAADFSGGEATVQKLLEGLGFAVAVRQSSAAANGGPTAGSLGAWVLKCNPQVWNFAGFLAGDERMIDDWTVQEGYRSDMIEHGQRVLLWVTGSIDGPLPRGFWGSGWTTGTVQHLAATGDGDDAVDGDVVDYWLDLDARDRMRIAAPLELQVWDTPIRETQVVDVLGPDSLEVMRARQMSNPSWISADDLARLEPLLPPWAELGAPVEQVITLDPADGAGFGDPVTRRLVEIAAVGATREYYESRGYEVRSVEHENCGWDLTCTAPNGDIARVEVKGTAGARPIVLLTRNEYRSATEDAGWVLAVVTRAATRPTVSIHQPREVLTEAEPYVYKISFEE
ncbi:DUF3883 domain-containing protein [Pseudonocardia sp. WMMC193]|uniref:DUF3883 domain-containing protein n=1 Tax=Pseudonocardia sp. WMMC193 TaxID=2911965 RepID=UPI001F412341|nr:DUF3883 domain-containing protein [Pseudonocardia sp. WMMC193]MCF7552190.1 DUF3883 domain-containing protein [Pseudonocardia sp. WMMC193]